MPTLKKSVIYRGQIYNPGDESELPKEAMPRLEEIGAFEESKPAPKSSGPQNPPKAPSSGGTSTSGQGT